MTVRIASQCAGCKQWKNLSHIFFFTIYNGLELHLCILYMGQNETKVIAALPCECFKKTGNLQFKYYVRVVLSKRQSYLAPEILAAIGKSCQKPTKRGYYKNDFSRQHSTLQIMLGETTISPVPNILTKCSTTIDLIYSFSHGRRLYARILNVSNN